MACTGNLICHSATGGAGYHGFDVFELADGNLKTKESIQVDDSINPEDGDKLDELQKKYFDMEMNVLFNPLSEFEK